MTIMDERARVAEVARYRHGDILADRVFTDTIELARHLFNASWSSITLIDDDRHWFVAATGLDVAESVWRHDTLCNMAILSVDPMIVPDASSHPALRDNRYVTGAPHIRFYAGIPLRSPEGAMLGTLCVADHRPRGEIDEQQVAHLQMLAAITVDRLHARMLAYEATVVTDALAMQAVDLCERAEAVDTLAGAIDAAGKDDALQADATAQGVRQFTTLAAEIEEHVSTALIAEPAAATLTGGFRIVEDDFALQQALGSAVRHDLDELIRRSESARAQREALATESRSLLGRSARLSRTAKQRLAVATAR